ncbi:MAG: GNAT family N-acetyltransferase [Candidatus Dormibacteraeota bacterium]|nr:GNAT family N-acetyltransferase [Candidatus Dormibacteraeota bacterium]
MTADAAGGERVSEPVLVARPFGSGHASAWDDLVRRSTTGTLLHTRRYLSYHADRYEDRSMVIYDAADRIVAVFPAARDLDDPTMVVSHPGITYGGLVSEDRLNAESVVEALELVVRAYRATGFQRLVYKAVPTIFHRRVQGSDVHALFRAGAAWTRSELAAFVDVNHRGHVSRGRSSAIRKALRSGIELSSGPAELAAFWPVLTSVLRQRHGAVPTHSRDEMEHLAALFPAEIECLVARDRGTVLAGAVVYVTPVSLHTQYLASSPQGRTASALDLVVEGIIDRASALAKRYVSLGTSAGKGGLGLNPGLHEYKLSFGACTTTFDWYTVPIT